MKYDVKIRVGNQDYTFGKGIVLLLEGVEKYGSLSASYKAIGMSSSKAWKILNRAQEDLGFALLESKVGGIDGGKTILTEQGIEFLNTYKQMAEEIQVFSKLAFDKYFSCIR